MNRANVDASDRSQKYTKVYHEMVVNTVKQKRHEKDLYNTELGFRRAAYELIKFQKLYGAQVMHYWNELMKLECNRMDTINRSFISYFNKFQDVYGNQANVDLPMKLFTKFNSVSECEQNFSISSILVPEEIEFIKKTLNVANIGPVEMRSYLEDFVFKDSNDLHQLVIKEFRILRDTGSVTKSFTPCRVVATVDNFLIFFEHPGNEE